MSHSEAMRGPWMGPHTRGPHSRTPGPWFDALRAAAAEEDDRGDPRHRGGGGGRRGPRGGRRGPAGGFPFGGPPGFDPRMFGRGFPGRGFGRGRRARKGDVRAGILALLREGPRNGYQMIQELEERSNGYWRPSPGSVYPALQQLEDEGLVATTEVDGRKAYELTDEGRAHVESRPGEYDAPWEALSGQGDDAVHEVGALGAQLAGAVMQVVQAGNDAQLEQAKQVLTEARRKLYRILAEDEPATTDDADDA